MMKIMFRVVVVLLLAYLYAGVLMSAFAADDSRAAVSFDLTRVKVSEVVHLMYRDVLKTPYVIGPDVVNDDRVVSFRMESTAKGRADVVRLLDSFGLSVTSQVGVDLVSIKKDIEPEKEVFVYRPKFRDASYLVELCRMLFKGQFTMTRAVHAPAGQAIEGSAPPGSAAALIDRSADALVFHGSAAEVRQLGKLLAQVDDRQGEVIVRGVVYEVGSSDKDGSAFSLALNLLKGKIAVGVGAGNPLENAVRLSTNTIEAVVSSLSADSRFKVISSPSLRVRSGASGRFSVGQEVPVLGAVAYPGAGQQPVQSIEYRSSGVIFDLQPVVRGEVVDLNVSQQLSSFVATDTGVNGSPTLIKREVKTALSLGDGDVVVLGGLAENKESGGRSGLSFLPTFMHTNTSEKSRSEILLILQLSRI